MSFGEDVRNFLNKRLNSKSTLFHKYQNEQLARHRVFFDTVEKNPLTDAQRRAVILNERRNLVVAGAGSGKTSVIVAKAGYLIESGICEPDDMLLLAFGADAASELSERCRERLGVEIEATTFHALGNRILGAVEEEQPSLSKLALDDGALSRFLEDILEELAADKKKWPKLKGFVLSHLKPYKEEAEFETLEAYAAYVRSVQLRALSGDLVKSFAELDIANFFFKGIEFEYEKRYPNTPKPYQPDFYLPEYDIWLEHFGVDREGGTAPFVDEKSYKLGMEWKRALHNERGTDLIETYSYQKSEGTLLEDLQDMLIERGVQFQERSQHEIVEALKRAGYVSQLSKLVGVFLTHFKSGDSNISKLRAQAGSTGDRNRALIFLDLFELFYRRYEEELANSEPPEIDFNDMISRAARYVSRSTFEVPWKHIIVDEFQDISQGRYRLLESMLRQKESLQFFAVGDDWQSIYRFAGSDISIMSRFRKFFGKATILKLDTTFRFKDKIAGVSSRFIQRNPAQIKKRLSTRSTAERPQVYLHWSDGDPDTERLDRASLQRLKEIAEGDYELNDASLQVLARYRHQLPQHKDMNEISNVWPGQLLEPRTIHRSKGLEADFVILNALSGAKYGFPSEIEDDPLLSLVLAAPDKYAHAEERRLFYVALTRARKQVHLIVDRKRPSVFAEELINSGYDIFEVGSRAGGDHFCPECKTGRIESKPNGFAYCLNFPYCEYKAPKCPKCDSGFLVTHETAEETSFRCSNEWCAGTAEICSKCGMGAMLPKEGRYGSFYGCSNWPICTNTHN